MKFTDRTEALKAWKAAVTNDETMDAFLVWRSHQEEDYAERAAESQVPVLGTPEADVVLERIAAENRERGYGPAGQQTREGAERAQAEYEESQRVLAHNVSVCRYCKAAKTRAVKKLDKALQGAVPAAYGRNPQYYIEALERKVTDARCKEHAERSRLNYVCSPVSETYWAS